MHCRRLIMQEAPEDALRRPKRCNMFDSNSLGNNSCDRLNEEAINNMPHHEAILSWKTTKTIRLPNL